MQHSSRKCTRTHAFQDFNFIKSEPGNVDSLSGGIGFREQDWKSYPTIHVKLSMSKHAEHFSMLRMDFHLWFMLMVPT